MKGYFFSIIIPTLGFLSCSDIGPGDFASGDATIVNNCTETLTVYYAKQDSYDYPQAKQMSATIAAGQSQGISIQHQVFPTNQLPIIGDNQPKLYDIITIPNTLSMTGADVPCQ